MDEYDWALEIVVKASYQQRQALLKALLDECKSAEVCDTLEDYGYFDREE